MMMKAEEDLLLDSIPPLVAAPSSPSPPLKETLTFDQDPVPRDLCSDQTASISPQAQR